MLFRKDERTPEQDVIRPSTFREDPSERTHMYPGPEPDFAVPDENAPEPGELGFETHPEPAIPVYLVSPTPNDRSYVEWSSMTVGITDTRATQIASYDRRRRRLRVKNLDETNSVMVFRNSTDLNHTGYTIEAGAVEEFLHNSGVWVRGVTAATTVQVSVYSEYDLDEYEDDK